MAVALTGDEPSYSKTYAAIWDFSAPCYSEKNHEIYMFGGGHQATTINLLTKWVMNQNTPAVVVACPATDKDIRKANLAAFFNPEYDNKTYFVETEPKPYSPHSYTNNMYSDEFISFGLAAMMSPGVNGDGAGGGWSSSNIAAFPRNGPWRANGYYPASAVLNQTNPTPQRGPRFMSTDGKIVYYWLASLGLNKFTLATKTHANIGGSNAIDFYARTADEGNGRALIMGTINSGGSWLAKFANLANGAITDITMSGDAMPNNMGCYDMCWCPDKGYYVALWINSSAMFTEATPITSLIVATITPTGASTATAAIQTVTGTGPNKMGVFRGVFYDRTFGCVLVVSHETDPVRAIKIT